ncbi:MAG: AAA family ATPase [bacterium]|nr:AAA family ATPase [bacterium]
MGIRIEEIRIRNFRSLKNVNMSLDSLTLLVGQNNSGKTSLLKCLQLALGVGYKKVSKEDIFISKDEVLPDDRKAIIDILIVPVNDEKKREPDFDAIWLDHWGAAIIIDDNDSGAVAIRTQIEYDRLKNDYVINQSTLDEWLEDRENIENTKINRDAQITWKQLEAVPLFFMDAQRDMHEDLKDRSSYWGKLVSDVGLSDSEVEKLEETLNDINERIITKSDVLKHLKGKLEKLNKTISGADEGVKINPITRKIRDLNRGMDIYYQDGNAESFPLSNHGMGTRSWATLLTFEAYISWMAKQSEQNQKPFFPILALEEPEAHLHPQAQRQIFEQLNGIPGQKIISTHSPYIASQTKLDSIRHFYKENESSLINAMDLSGLTPEELRKIEREVMNTRGELLFAKALVLFEGETEEQALPTISRPTLTGKSTRTRIPLQKYP